MINSVEWDQVDPMAMPAFLGRFTLHDSWFKGLNISDEGHLIVDIDFDLVWNSAVPGGFDNLVLRFDRPYRVRWVQGSFDLCTISDAESLVLDPAARADLLNQGDFDLRAYQGPRDDIPHPASDETLTCTRLQFLNWAVLEVLHGADVRVVVLDADARKIDVSTIANAAT